MINFGEEQNLGHKALILLVTKSFVSGFFLMFLAGIIVIFKKYLISGIGSTLVATNASGTSALNVASAILMFLTIAFFCVGVLIFFVGGLIAYLKHISTTYTFNEFDLVIKTGILHKKENLILYRQIRDINIERSLTYRLFGLSRIDIVSSEIEETKEEGITRVHLDPIDKDIAQEIRDILAKKVGVPVLETTNRMN